jgi:ATP diphosphatase
MKNNAGIAHLLDVMAQLRDPDNGCPWDIEQTFETIAPYTIEEAYEVAEAIAVGDMAHLRDELGDLLLQVAYHTQMAEEAGHFDFDDVAQGIADKMVRRHPHVFGDEDIADATAQTLAWEEQKAAERNARAKTQDRHPSALEGVALALPALTRAEKLQKRAARVGFDWPDAAPVQAKIDEELTELRDEIDAGGDPARLHEELGDLLFSVVNLARHLSIDPEKALRDANRKFQFRFENIEQYVEKQGKTVQECDLETLDRIWNEVKAQARS